jgi:hypothetical protein
MEIKRNGSQPSGKGPADWFTGTVRIDPLFQANSPARAFAASVTFEPGARTAWHTHPLGQTLLVRCLVFFFSEAASWFPSFIRTSAKMFCTSPFWGLIIAACVQPAKVLNSILGNGILPGRAQAGHW